MLTFIVKMILNYFDFWLTLNVRPMILGKKSTGTTENGQVIFRARIQDKGQFHVQSVH